MSIAQDREVIRELGPKYLSVFGKPEADVSALIATRQKALPETSTELDDAELDVNGNPLENVRLCPRCNTFDIDGDMTICPSCEDEIAEENPDGQWCFSRDAGCWIYE